MLIALSRTFFHHFHLLSTLFIMILRHFHTSLKRSFKLDPNFKFKCGLEIHTQLKTKYKLFSLSETSFNELPNTKISHFDIGLPGTQPKLNPEALYLALKLATALNFDIKLKSKFDRKHYFYPDQPLGYQITQYFDPVAVNGSLDLYKSYDDIDEDMKTIHLRQIQLEQDTGKINYNDFENEIKLDFNRANIPLIELITEPDFENLTQVKQFIKKYHLLVKYLDICTGDLETGAMRVDVNLSVNNGNRVEIKNLGSSGEIQEALMFEYNRQVKELKNGVVIEQETRGWDGETTIKLRSKEDAVDYRYFPDPELPIIYLDKNIKQDISNQLPMLPDQLIQRLLNEPYNLEMRHAKFLIHNTDILQYYQSLFEKTVTHNHGSPKLVNNWLIHELMGSFNKLNIPFDIRLILVDSLSQIILKVEKGDLTSTAGKTLLLELIKAPNEEVDNLIEKLDLALPQVSEEDLNDAVEELCHEIIENNQDVVDKIKSGKTKSINYLLGLAMKETQGKVNSKIFLETLKNMIYKK